MPQNHARHGFDFEVFQTVFLLAGKVAHLRLREGDILKITRRNLIHGRFDLRGAQEKFFGFPIVEFF